jgi:outer membrane protein OmpA-like peptidoglycan-associated protein
MTYRLALPAALLLLAGPAWGQVSVDPRALEQLSEPAPPPHHPAPDHKPATKPADHPTTGRTASTPAPTTDKHVASAKPATVTPPKPPAATTPGTTPAPLPTIPAAPPAIATLPPPAKVPTRPAGAAPVVPLVADAPGLASKINGGMRVTFGTDRADLNSNTAGALRSIAHVAQTSPSMSVNVFAYAAGTAEDPSTPRRLSLSRAIAARAVLVNEGIPSTRIYVRALGSNDTAGGPADRVDVVLGGDGTPGGSSGGSSGGAGGGAAGAGAASQPAATSNSTAQ